MGSETFPKSGQKSKMPVSDVDQSVVLPSMDAMWAGGEAPEESRRYPTTNYGKTEAKRAANKGGDPLDVARTITYISGKFGSAG